MERELSRHGTDGAVSGFIAGTSIDVKQFEMSNQAEERSYVIRRKHKVVEVNISTLPNSMLVDGGIAVRYDDCQKDDIIISTDSCSIVDSSVEPQKITLQEEIKTDLVKRKRGRHCKVLDVTGSTIIAVGIKRKRGRPKKISQLSGIVVDTTIAATRKRGRPRKLKQQEEVIIESTRDIATKSSSNISDNVTAQIQRRGRGRPKKVVETVSPKKPIVITGRENVVIRTKPTYRMIVLESGPVPKRGRKKEMPVIQERWGFMNRYSGYIQDEFFRRKSEAIAWMERTKQTNWQSIERHSEFVLIKVELNIKEVGNTKLELFEDKLIETAS